ncbi:MAG: type II secretion system F family protein [Rhodanobacter sp.]
MTLALVLFSAVSLLLAAAIELWWGSPLRQQQRRSLATIEKTLGEQNAPSSLSPARHAPRPEGLVTDALCLRAGLPTGWRMPILLAVPACVLAALGAWRMGTAWAVPFLLGTYAAVAWLWLRARIEKQRKQLIRQMPDFLDAMVRLASIGNSLPMAFQTASASVQMPLRGVLDRTMISVRSGQELDHALEMASAPYRLEALNLLHVVLGTAVRMGGRADHILQRMSDFMRDLGHAQQELRAITSETRMSAWVLGLLPVVVSVFMSLSNPAFFGPMFTHSLGHRILLLALALEALGGFLLYRLAKSL